MRPRRVEITEALKPGDNSLEIEVVNLWPNRLVGDGALSKDRRRTNTCVPGYYVGKGRLLPSGLLGPVRVIAEE